MRLVQSEDPLVLDPRAPLETARRFVEAHHMVADLRTLHHQQLVFAKWTGTHYREIHTEEMRAEIYAFLEPAFVSVVSKKGVSSLRPFKPSSRTVSDVLDALRAACQLDGLTRYPAWLDDDDGSLPAPVELISCENGLLHLPTSQVLAHSPNFYSNTSLGYSYVPTAPAPVAWLAFLNSIWVDDPSAIATLQDVFGYLLGNDTDQQKIALLVGPKRSGKGTIARILGALVGESAVVSPTLAALETNFGLAPLIGKRIALIADARLSGRADQQAIAERLLSISGEDMQTIDRKHIQAWSGKLAARFFIMSNELPRISDASGALASRFLVITMKRSFFGNEDHGLLQKLMPELPGILNWAIEGWRRLRERGYFLQPDSSRETMQELEDLGSPMGAFVRDRCVIEQGKSVGVDQLFEEWKAWCKDQGRDYTGSKGTFGKDLRAVHPGLATRQARDGGDRTRIYEGIGLQDRVVWSAKDDKDDDLGL